MMRRFLWLLLPFALLASDPARVNLNLGTSSNDGTGDGLRTTFTKLNTNVINLWAQAFTNLPASIAASGGDGKLNTTNGVAVRLSGSLTNVTANGITLTANGISSAVNMTAGDLQDLSSFGVFDATVPTRVRVLRDGSGYILGSGRWYNKATTDTRTSDAITIILPIDVASDALPGRWVLEGYEQ